MFMVSAVELVWFGYLFGSGIVLWWAGLSQNITLALASSSSDALFECNILFQLVFSDGCFERPAQSMAVNHCYLFGKHTADTVVMLEKAFQNDAMILSFQCDQPNRQQKTRLTLDILTFLKSLQYETGNGPCLESCTCTSLFQSLPQSSHPSNKPSSAVL